MQCLTSNKFICYNSLNVHSPPDPLPLELCLEDMNTTLAVKRLVPLHGAPPRVSQEHYSLEY